MIGIYSPCSPTSIHPPAPILNKRNGFCGRKSTVFTYFTSEASRWHKRAHVWRDATRGTLKQFRAMLLCPLICIPVTSVKFSAVKPPAVILTLDCYRFYGTYEVVWVSQIYSLHCLRTFILRTCITVYDFFYFTELPDEDWPPPSPCHMSVRGTQEPGLWDCPGCLNAIGGLCVYNTADEENNSKILIMILWRLHIYCPNTSNSCRL